MTSVQSPVGKPAYARLLGRFVGWSVGVALLFAFGTPAAQAELTWADKTVEVTGDASSPLLEAHFKFTNSGVEPVEIRRIESSCGCTTAALEKRRYQPRESGEIVARYTVGTHTGAQRKTLLVVTDDGRPPTTLALVARIPEILRVVPTAATWAHKESSAPKSITLELMQESPIDEISVESSNANMATELVTVIKGRKYSLRLAPKQTDRFLYAKLTIHCRFGKEEKTFLAYATVIPSTGER